MNESERLALALKGLSVLRHDVRNLMASVEIIAHRMEASGDERLAKAGPMLVESMQRTVELGVAAGELATIEAQAPEAVNLGAAARRGLEAGNVMADAGGGIDAGGLEGLTVRADPAHVERMLGALAVNGLALADPGRVVFEGSREGDAVLVRVRCEGHVPDYAKDKVLTPYGGAKRRGGTGLGLPVARLMAEENGGSLVMEETGGGGTVFALRLPAA